MKLEKICFIILVLFGFFGTLIFSNLIHEMSHEHDFRFVSDKGTVCVLTKAGIFPDNFSEFWDEPAGFYQFTVKEGLREEYKEISKYTEWRSYSYNFVIYFVFIICVWVVWRKRNER